jgi:hypothetical protein
MKRGAVAACAGVLAAAALVGVLADTLGRGVVVDAVVAGVLPVATMPADTLLAECAAANVGDGGSGSTDDAIIDLGLPGRSRPLHEIARGMRSHRPARTTTKQGKTHPIRRRSLASSLLGLCAHAQFHARTHMPRALKQSP